MNGVHSTPTQRLPGDLRSPSQKSLLLFADSKNRDRKLLQGRGASRPIKNIELVSARVPKNSLSPY